MKAFEMGPYFTRNWKVNYSWCQPVGYPFIRFRMFVRRHMPYPGLYILIKLGKLQHTVGLAATFRYSQECFEVVERAGQDGRIVTPYEVAGRIESK